MSRGEDVPRRVIILLVGGPGGSALSLPITEDDAPDDLFPFYESLVRAGDFIVLPAYAGTAERTFFPQSDMTLALQELESLTNVLSAQYQDRPVIIHGMSLGGHLAFRLSERLDPVPIVLLNPVLSTPRELLRFARTNPATPEIEHAWVQRQVWRRDRQGSVTTHNEMIPLLTSFERFFGGALDETASDLLLNRRGPVTIIYSANDDRIGVETIGDLQGRQNIRIIETGTSGHFIRRDEERRRVISALTTAFNDPNLD